MTAKTLPGFDFRRMCLAGIRAAESAHGAGRTLTLCPATGAPLKCDEHGIWAVCDASSWTASAALIGIDMGAPEGDRHVTERPCPSAD